MDYCRNRCDFEVIYLKRLLKNETLVKLVKKTLTKMIHKLEKIGVNLNTLLSDSKYTGNLGLNKDLISYLKSNKSNIREKVAAISNTFWDSKKEIPQYKNCEIFFNYIISNNNSKNCKSLYEAIKVITKNKYPENLDSKNKKISQLWCPLFYIFPGYIFKRNTINLHDLLQKKKSRSMRKNEIIEPFSKKEINFLKSKKISLNNNIIDIEVGRDLYKNKVCNLFNYNNTKFSCRIAGVSGHAILHFTLGLILDIDLRIIFIGQMFEMVPLHHSIEEICFGLNDLNFFFKNTNIKMDLFNNHKEMMEYIDKHIVNHVLKNT